MKIKTLMALRLVTGIKDVSTKPEIKKIMASLMGCLCRSIRKRYGPYLPTAAPLLVEVCRAVEGESEESEEVVKIQPIYSTYILLARSIDIQSEIFSPLPTHTHALMHINSLSLHLLKFTLSYSYNFFYIDHCRSFEK